MLVLVEVGGGAVETVGAAVASGAQAAVTTLAAAAQTAGAIRVAGGQSNLMMLRANWLVGRKQRVRAAGACIIII